MIFVNFDIDNFGSKVLPTFMRKPILKGFVRVLLISLESLWASLDSFYQSVLNDLAVTIQTNLLQDYLRVLYPDVGSFKVFIKTQWDNIPQEYIQYIGEHQKTEYCKLLSEVTPSEYEWLLIERDLPHDYYVILPTTYTSSLAAITSLINRKKPAGKRYQILFQNITA